MTATVTGGAGATVPAGTPARPRPFLGTGQLTRLALRRDRVLVPVWLAVFVFMAASSASATVGLYPTLTSRIEAAGAINGTPSLVALYGRVYDPTSIGALSLIKLSAMGAALVAVLTIILTVRHTRAEEEAGRLELLGATVIGRRAPLTAALLLVTGTSLALGALTAGGLSAAGLPTGGSLAFGASWALTGIAFAAVAATVAQLTSTARAATGLTSALLGAAYLLRAIGDSAPADGARWVSWLSPVAWGQQVRPFAGDRWVVLLLPLTLAVLAVTAAYVLAGRRDLGVGMLPDRPGPVTAAPWLRSPLALAWRLQRGTFTGWLAAFVLLGVALGSIAGSVGNFATSDAARELFARLGGEKGLTDAFLATEMSFLAVLTSAFGVQAALRLRGEETGLRTEPLLGAPVGRLRWLASHVLVAFGGALFLLLAGGAAAGLSWAVVSGRSEEFGRVLAGAAVQIPSAWLVTSLVVAAFGLWPRAVSVGWAALVAFLLLGEFGPLFEFDQWVLDISPYVHTPKLPGSSFTAVPLLWQLAVTVLLLLVGAFGFRRRDLG
jgi:ABC-2 type transport system permease protein